MSKAARDGGSPVMQTLVLFPEFSATGLTFDGKRVESGPRAQAEVPRQTLRTMFQRALWEAFAASPECAEGAVHGQIYLDGPRIELKVGDYSMALRYDAERDLMVIAPRDGFSVCCVEFAWLVRALLEWVDDQQPDGR